MGQLGAPVTESYVSSENFVIHDLGVCAHGGALAVRAGVTTILVFYEGTATEGSGHPFRWSLWFPVVTGEGTQTHFLSPLGNGYEAYYSAALPSAQEGGDAEGPA